MGPAEKRRYLGDVKAPGDKKEDVFYLFFVYLYKCPQVGSFKGGMSLTLVTFFFETSKLWANILALVGMECQRAKIKPLQAIGTIRALLGPSSTRLEPP